jgi:hypothetical protein
MSSMIRLRAPHSLPAKIRTVGAVRSRLIQLTEGFGLTKNDRLIYEEIARVRYLVGHGFRMLIGGQDATAEMWKKTTEDADYHREVIADDLLSRSNIGRALGCKQTID